MRPVVEGDVVPELLRVAVLEHRCGRRRARTSSAVAVRRNHRSGTARTSTYTAHRSSSANGTIAMSAPRPIQSSVSRASPELEPEILRPRRRPCRGTGARRSPPRPRAGRGRRRTRDACPTPAAVPAGTGPGRGATVRRTGSRRGDRPPWPIGSCSTAMWATPMRRGVGEVATPDRHGRWWQLVEVLVLAEVRLQPEARGRACSPDAVGSWAIDLPSRSDDRGEHHDRHADDAPRDGGRHAPLVARCRRRP